MDITFKINTLPASGSVIITSFEDRKLSSFFGKISSKLKGIIEKSSFKGKRGQVLILHDVGKLNHVVALGLGKAKDLNAHTLAEIGGGLYAALNGAGIKAATLLLDKKQSAYGADLANGVLLRSYRFDKYKTDKKANGAKFKKLVVGVDNVAAARKDFTPLKAVAQGVFMARDLLIEPANVLTPKEFMRRSKSLQKEGVKVSILNQKQMEKQGFGGLLCVSQGSQHEPYLVTMEWHGGKKSQKPVVFVGKGVTFDTGGISIKPSASMDKMKMDMGGAAAVTGLMKTLAARKAKTNVVGVIGLVENMVSRAAMRPGDVVKTLSGKTVEIVNTDAEGRMVLCDAMWYAQQKFKPEVMVDLATLTGAILVALGMEYFGIFANDDKLSDQLYKAGQKTGEKSWRMPLDSAFDETLKSSIADINHCPPVRYAGSSIAAQYLQRFVQDKVKWAHLDIAAVAFSAGSKAKGYNPDDCIHNGVRLIHEFVAANFE